MKDTSLLMCLVWVIFFCLFPQNIFARSGCCSHHGGVCGCGCCDGTGLSSVCAPYYPECNRQIYTEPTKVPTIKPTNTPTLLPTPTTSPTHTPIPVSATEAEPTVRLTPVVMGTTSASEPSVEVAENANSISAEGVLLLISSLGLGFYGFRKLRNIKRLEGERKEA